ncbi:hypothetical protein IJH02_02535 [Candidatus Saccharibacteria bacterium]|nr:hypothetical protein [Candidatus Saccharibacteria bacterium]
MSIIRKPHQPVRVGLVIGVLTLLLSVTAIIAVLMAAHAHDAEEALAGARAEAEAKTKAAEAPAETTEAKAEVGPDGKALSVIVGLRDLAEPEKSGGYVREGRMVSINLVSELEKLGFTNISASATTANGPAEVSAELPDCEDALRLATTYDAEDEEKFFVEATVRKPGGFPISLTREYQCFFGELTIGPEDSALLPTVLFQDEELGLILTESQLDCIRWLVGNNIPDNTRFIEDVVPFLSKNTS